MLTLESLLFLQSDRGKIALAMARDLLPDLPLHQAVDRLRKQFQNPHAVSALEMADLRRRAKEKFSRADRMFFIREALEQSSGEIISSYRAERFGRHFSSPAKPVERPDLTDLCCGIGGDALALAQIAARPLEAVDRDPVRLACLQANLVAHSLQHRCRVIEADVLDYRVQTPLVFIDPSRRSDGRRVKAGEEYSPALSFVHNLADQVQGLAAKLAPGLHLPETGLDREVELISQDRSCREMVIWTGCLYTCRRRATVLRRRGPGAFAWDAFSLASDAAPEAVSESRPAAVLDRLPQSGDFLLEPDPAVVRAHLVEMLADQLDATLLDPQIAYLVTSTRIESPFAATYQIVDAFWYSEKRLKEWLTQRKVGHLTVKKRGFPQSPEEIRSRLRLKGPEAATVVLTRRGDRHLAILVEE